MSADVFTKTKQNLMKHSTVWKASEIATWPPENWGKNCHCHGLFKPSQSWWQHCVPPDRHQIPTWDGHSPLLEQSQLWRILWRSNTSRRLSSLVWLQVDHQQMDPPFWPSFKIQMWFVASTKTGSWSNLPKIHLLKNKAPGPKAPGALKNKQDPTWIAVQILDFHSFEFHFSNQILEFQISQQNGKSARNLKVQSEIPPAQQYHI